MGYCGGSCPPTSQTRCTSCVCLWCHPACHVRRQRRWLCAQPTAVLAACHRQFWRCRLRPLSHTVPSHLGYHSMTSPLGRAVYHPKAAASQLRPAAKSVLRAKALGQAGTATGRKFSTASRQPVRVICCLRVISMLHWTYQWCRACSWNLPRSS